MAIFLTAWSGASAHAQANAGALAPSAALHGSMPRLMLAPAPLLLEEQAPRELHYERRWYGWQTLLIDAASLGLMFTAAASDSPALYWVGIGSFVFGPAIAHAAHGHFAATLASIGMRVGFVLLIWFAALLVANDAFVDDANDGSIALFGVVTLVGVIGASAIDAAVLAYDRVLVGGQALLRPWYDARSGSAGLRVAGSF